MNAARRLFCGCAALLMGAALEAQAATTPAQAAAASADIARAFVETAVPRATCFVGERVDVRLLVGYDTAFFKASGIPLFRREVDVPLHVRAPWLRELAGATLPGAPGTAQPPDGAVMSLAVNDAVMDATRVSDRVVDGRTFTVVELARPVVATRPGELVLPAATVNFAFASSFRDDVFSGRVAADRHDAHVTGGPVTLTVAPLPEAGRPAGFSGAVGHFTVTAESGASSATVGMSLHVALRITGDGNLQLIETPRLADIPGFRILGMIDTRGIGDRTVTFDIAPTADSVTAIPALPFSFFDPDPPGAYRTVFTTPLMLKVRPPAAVTRPASRPFVMPVTPPGPEVDASLPTPLAWGAVVSAVVLTLAVLRARARVAARERDARDPAGARARRAGAAFHAHVSGAAASANLADAFAEFLAAHLRCAPPAVITADLTARLTAAGASPADAAGAASLLDELTHARYGGAAPADAARRASALVAALNPALLTASLTTSAPGRH